MNLAGQQGAGRLMVAFAGTELSDAARALVAGGVAGVTLFRYHNVSSPAQVRALTAALQAATPPGNRPLLVATDQEGGQLNALGEETTLFAGPMALGAAGDDGLAERVANATARELRALGINVNYVPVCDLASNPANPALGLRSFGDDPSAVGHLVAATVRGLQAEGVAATLKHFPGSGEAAVDTHDELAVVDAGRDVLERRELVPFRAGIEAGARLVMAGHVAVPGINGDETLPATLAPAVVTGLLRDELRFPGLAITDALDMQAIGQGAAQIVDVIAALRAGQDLLLGTPEGEVVERMTGAVAQAELRGLVDRRASRRSTERLEELRAWLRGFDQPPLGVVACSEHAALAAELAARSITLVRDDDGLLPLTLDTEARVLVVHSRHFDLTKADTTSLVPPTLAAAIRRRLPRTEELLLSPEPAPDEIRAARERAADYDVVIVGTFAANMQPRQAELARAVLDAQRPTVTVALRTPWDLPNYRAARTHLCSFGVLPATTEALAAALFGERQLSGRLPVEMYGLFPRGHGIERPARLGVAGR